MDWFECWLNFNVLLFRWLVIKFYRLTLLRKIVVVVVLLSLFGLPLGFRKMARRHGERRQPRPIMNYIHASTEASFESSPATSTAGMATTASARTTTPVQRSKAARTKHEAPETAEQRQAEHKGQQEDVKNVLFLMSDDFRAPPQYTTAGSGVSYKLHIPNIEHLESESLVLQRAYCQYSLCGPSRSSLLTGRSPDTTKVYQNNVYWRETGGPFTTLPQYFKENGYKTYSLGKVFHIQMHREHNDPISWSAGIYTPPVVRHIKDVNANWISVSEKQRAKNPLEDDYLVAHATKILRRLAGRSKAKQRAEPFFMAIGFYRPHVPMVCPEKFFKQYALEEGQQYLADVRWQTPEYLQVHGMASFEEGTKDNSHLTHVPDTALRYLRRAYFACISYVDHLIGILLKVLDEEGLANTTVVSLVADHGFHLGENNVVSKYSNHEVALQVPLIIKIPGLTDGGIKSRSLVQLLDVFPTITAAVGLPQPPPCPERSTDIRLCMEGQNLLPLTVKPNISLHAAVYSQVARGRHITEYSIRTNRIRYIDFATFKRIPLPGNRIRLELNWNVDLMYTKLVRQLYDHARDPHERFNLYHHPEYREYKAYMKHMLQQRFAVIHDFPAGLY